MRYEHTHPEEMLKEVVIDPLNISIAEFASKIKFNSKLLEKFVSKETLLVGIEMAILAIRLEKAEFSTASFWMTLWSNYHLSLALTLVQEDK